VDEGGAGRAGDEGDLREQDQPVGAVPKRPDRPQLHHRVHEARGDDEHEGGKGDPAEGRQHVPHHGGARGAIAQSRPPRERDQSRAAEPDGAAGEVSPVGEDGEAARFGRVRVPGRNDAAEGGKSRECRDPRRPPGQGDGHERDTHERDARHSRLAREQVVVERTDGEAARRDGRVDDRGQGGQPGRRQAGVEDERVGSRESRLRAGQGRSLHRRTRARQRRHPTTRGRRRRRDLARGRGGGPSRHRPAGAEQRADQQRPGKQEERRVEQAARQRARPTAPGERALLDCLGRRPGGGTHPEAV
jgi:hypothetical protein